MSCLGFTTKLWAWITLFSEDYEGKNLLTTCPRPLVNLWTVFVPEDYEVKQLING